LFFALAIQDLARAADLFLPVYESSSTVDGYVSLEVSPLLAHDSDATLKQAQALHAQAGKPNLFIKIPGTAEGIEAIEEAIFAGVPVNVTLLFSTGQYVRAADAHLRGLERRVAAGLPADVRSVASLFISRSDVAVADEIMDGERFQRLANQGARAQRLLFASTGTKDKHASDTLYVDGLAAPNTINTMPDNTLLSLAKHGGRPVSMVRDTRGAHAVLAAHRAAGIDLDELAAKLQAVGAEGFIKSWNELLASVDAKGVVAA
jgi:transaldolase